MISAAIKRKIAALSELADRRRAADFYLPECNWSPELKRAVDNYHAKNSAIRAAGDNVYEFLLQNPDHRLPRRPISEKARALFPSILDRDRMSDEQWKGHCAALLKRRIAAKLERWAKL